MKSLVLSYLLSFFLSSFCVCVHVLIHIRICALIISFGHFGFDDKNVFFDAHFSLPCSLCQAQQIAKSVGHSLAGVYSVVLSAMHQNISFSSEEVRLRFFIPPCKL